MPVTKIDGKPIGYLVSWLESERGWGTRPDGYSLHASVEDYSRYLADYNARLPQEVPDEYSRPDSEPQAVVLSPGLARRLEYDASLRFWNGSLIVDVSPTGQRTVQEKKPVKTTFIDLCLAKKVSPEDVDDFVQKWHEGDGEEGETLRDYLGLSVEEYIKFMQDPKALYEILYNRMPATAA